MNAVGIYENREINEALKKALSEKGEDYIYQSEEVGNSGCFYAIDEAPACIVGHVLNALDPEMFKQVAVWEQDAEDTGFRRAAAELHLPFNEDQIMALQAAQIAQDDGHKWSAAARQYSALLGETL